MGPLLLLRSCEAGMPLEVMQEYICCRCTEEMNFVRGFALGLTYNIEILRCFHPIFEGIW